MELSASLSRATHKLQPNFELHSHYFVSGPRNMSGIGRDGKWHVSGETITHSHPGGGVPHKHPETGPAFYGYGARKPKTTTKAAGEQLEYVAATEEESSFDLVITDSALLHGKTPIGDTPLEEIGMPAADRMKDGFRMKCIVRDERRKKA